MKVLIIQESGRHEENRNFRECLSLRRAFIYNGHDCDVWGLGHDNYNNIPEWESYDLIMNIENYDSIGWVPNLSNINNPVKILWSIDSHCRGKDVYESTFYNGNYNILLHSTKDFVKKKHHLWFPNCFDDDLIGYRDVDKSSFIGFCGNYANRKELLDYMEMEFGLKKDIFVIGNSMVNAINSYMIHFNKNIFNDINYRNFETIATGTLLLTDYNSCYNDLGFIHNENCMFYNNIEEISDIINHLRNNPSEIKRIGGNGIELSKMHTYKERVKNLLKIIYDRSR